MNSTAQTIAPNSPADPGAEYIVPLYQRLYEWDETQLSTLLDDLHRAFVKDPQAPYYIGMLTARRTGKVQESLELIDGQQRMTAVMLIGGVLRKYHAAWGEFLGTSRAPRLALRARPDDEALLYELAQGPSDEADASPHNPDSLGSSGRKMLAGQQAIAQWLNDKKTKEGLDLAHFAQYVYERLTWFVGELPEDYDGQALNQYFERMNSQGKQLAPEEILKVELLASTGDEAPRLMATWNVLSDVHEYILADILEELREDGDLKFYITDELVQDEEERERKLFTLLPKPEGNDKPDTDDVTDESYSCPVSFAQQLLLTLYYDVLTAEQRQGVTKTDFFDPAQLLTTFRAYEPLDGKTFVERLWNNRKILDIYFVRNKSGNYQLQLSDREYSMGVKEPNGRLLDERAALEQLEGMLLASSSSATHYRWFGWLRAAVENGRTSYTELFSALDEADRAAHPLPDIKELCYGQVDRYWFWRLDMQLWLNRHCFFSSCQEADFAARILKAVKNYQFTSNRSIEHIAPRHPEGDASLQWPEGQEDTMNGFGNLCMLSAGQNSALSNRSYQVKEAILNDYCAGNKLGSVPSLKLLAAHMKHPATWDTAAIEQHGEEMYNLLRDWSEHGN